MKWRCEWCGKPHEENEPPCDACGHGSFEKAVVRVPDHETVDTGPSHVWACLDCGKEHVRNSPPCSRCGSPDLEKREQTHEDVADELEVSSYAELARPYLPIVGAFVLLAALVAAGVVPVPQLGDDGPSMPDAPGDGDQSGGLDLGAVENDVLDRLADERELALTRDEGLSSVVEFENRRRVIAANEGADAAPGPAPLDRFDPDCSGDAVGFEGRIPGDDGAVAADDEGGLTGLVVADLLSNPDFREEFDEDRPTAAVDLHIGPDGTTYVFYAQC